MNAALTGSPTHLLTRYLDAVSAAEDEPSATRTAIERAAAALSSPVGAVVIEGAVRARVSPAGLFPLLALTGASEGTTSLEIEGVGHFHTAVQTVNGPPDSSIVLARPDSPFSPAERELLAGMARALGLTLRALRTLEAGRTILTTRARESDDRLRLMDALGARQRLLETVLGIQRLVSSRRPLQEVLDAVTAGAASLLDRGAVALVLPDSLSPLGSETGQSRGESQGGRIEPASSGGPPERSHDPVILDAAAQAMRDNSVITRYLEGRPNPHEVVAAPITVRGAVAGGIAAEVPCRYGRGLDQGELLNALAQQVSVALTQASAAEAMRAARTDAITGLPHRSIFLERLQLASASAAEKQHDLAVILIDIFNFKSINQGLGREVGDSALSAVAARIRAAVRAADLVARVGGDEFGILLSGVNLPTARRIAQEIIETLRRPLGVAGHTVYLSASAGVASEGGSEVGGKDLFGHADLALNRAIQAGPSRVEHYGPGLRGRALARAGLLGDLQRAIDRSELGLHYQPLIDLSTGACVGVEALARWQHPSRGDVPPSTFIPLAEETGLILELGPHIVAEGCAQLAGWRRHLPDLRLSINISARQAIDPDFPDRVAKALAQAGLPGSALTLELAEGALRTDLDGALPQLHSLKDMGIRLSIDDFGAGRSSLSYLRSLPIDQLKIDRTFIMDSLVPSVLDVGRTLRLETVAEGIENQRQLETLRTVGCDLGQGFLLARPMDPAATSEYLLGQPLARQLRLTPQ